MKILRLQGRQILDSRGKPTVEVDLWGKDEGQYGKKETRVTASVPSGASTGQREAVEKRDRQKAYGGAGVTHVLEALKTVIEPALLGKDVTDQKAIDDLLITLDGTQNKSNLGANLLLPVSLATARAGAHSQDQELYTYLAHRWGVPANRLPMPFMNLINGGKHGDTPLDLQEMMIVPTGASSFAHAVQMGSEIFWALKTILQQKGYSVNVGDEGGFSPALTDPREGFDLLEHAIHRAGYTPGTQVMLALDCAASEWILPSLHPLDPPTYFLKGLNKRFSSEALIQFYETLCQEYPLISLEDGLGESDWVGWTHLTEALGDRLQLIGDDLFVTNPLLIQEGIDQKAANAVLIKPNQIGTLSETFSALRLARTAGYSVMISHRSGETEDTFIADLAVGVGAGQIKAGSLSRTDRVCKYNRLIRIEEALGAQGVFGSPFSSKPLPQSHCGSDAIRDQQHKVS